MGTIKLTWEEAIKLYPKEDIPAEDNPTPVNLGEYQTHDVDELDTGFGITYLGQQTKDGKFLIKKIVKVSESEEDYTITFANNSNNNLYVDYDLAWASRTTLDYDTLNNLSEIYI